MDMSMDMASTTMGDMKSTMAMDMPASQTSAGGMDHGMGGMGGTCKISMLWNWTVIDSCFISKQWHITSHGMFAGSCIGVVLLVIVLEALRRSVKEYDRYLIKNHVTKCNAASASAATNGGGSSVNSKDGAGPAACVALPPFRPSVLEQAVRSLLHMLQFAVAYFVMLLAMYYNGYMIICIFIGAYIGSFIFHWEPLTVSGERTTAASEATVCCG